MTPTRLAAAGALYGLLSTLASAVVLLVGDGEPSWPLTVGLLPLWPALLLVAAVRGERLRAGCLAAVGVALAQAAVVVGAFSGELLGYAVWSLPVLLLGLAAACGDVLTAAQRAGASQEVRP